MMEVGSHRWEGAPGLDTSKRGVKRQADESNLSDEQRFTKRFHLLSLKNLPKKASAVAVPGENDSSQGVDDVLSRRSSGAYLPVQTAMNHPANASEQSMDVDDTRDRVYIGDLDAEIADIDAHAPDERLVFLPDIEKHFTRIPHEVLTGRQRSSSLDSTPDDQRMVLYSVPRTLTDDEGSESVRRAILDARHRARDRAIEQARDENMSRQYAAPDGNQQAVETAHGYTTGYDQGADSDADAMDIG